MGAIRKLCTVIGTISKEGFISIDAVIKACNPIGAVNKVCIFTSAVNKMKILLDAVSRVYILICPIDGLRTQDTSNCTRMLTIFFNV